MKIIRSRAPLRIGFGGGGTDVRPYCEDYGGTVLNATINRHAHVTLIVGGDKFVIRSVDYDKSIEYGISDPFVYDGQLDLAKAVVDHFRAKLPAHAGLEVLLHNDAPPGSGLGSSSAITVALIMAMAEYLRISMDQYEIADVAYQIERVKLAQFGGRQDQYCAVFGGFNLMEFDRHGAVVHSLRIRPEIVCELEYSLVFAYVGGQRFSSHLIEQQIDKYERGEQEVLNALHRMKEIAYSMERALLVGNLREFGRLLNESWTEKRKTADGVTTPEIDEVYRKALCAGALGGKITGAGGGGFMFLLCEPVKRYQVQDAVRECGAQLVNFNFVEDGARAWCLP